MDQLRDWLILIRTPGLGPRTIARLLQHFTEPGDALNAGAHTLRQLGLSETVIDGLNHPDDTGLDRDLAWADEPDHHIITLNDPRYPRLLSEISDPPPVLFIHGQPGVLSSLQLAMVGSRNPTSTGADTAQAFARFLANAGLSITSGMAIGIDAACHQGALLAGGTTIAVAGTGLDRIYPARHRDLAQRITEHGALVSEFPTGVKALRENFPRRNRIIAGLSLGTLIVEATQKSGSLITARLAVDQGREVFAIPGSIHSPLARGCHALIREGAKLVETAQDILEELGPMALAASTPQMPDQHTETTRHTMDPDHQQLLALVGYDPTPVDMLVERSGLTAAEVSSILLILELHGLVSATPGGHYSRR
ncbi:MAG: DNA-processing protein DprA [Gammaproteobacteria bacterium]|nr:MAG: DNA-processing protein DprA [Gammaproteobacteria bacterium]